MITVICPVFNEEAYIRQLLDFFIGAQPDNKELVLIDGGSKDRTVAIIQEYQLRYPHIKLLHNPDKYVPFALNSAVSSSKGDPVIRLDAHTIYSNDYFEAVLRTFSKTGADIVGGPMRAEGTTPFQKSVAYATSTILGVGNSDFHDEKKEGFTESVYLGAWRRSVFEKTGLFDTDMLRNQDDEFHYRARNFGCTIYLDPSIRSTYFPRDSIGALSRQYYQYGLFKPLVLKKVRAGMRLRHLIPTVFLIYFCSLFMAFLFPWWLIPGGIYLILMLIFVIKGQLPFIGKLWLFVVYPVLHISYGAGFVQGLNTILNGRKPEL